MKKTEGGGVFLIHDACDAGVAGLGVCDCGERFRHWHVCDELLGVGIRLQDFWKITRRSNSRVLLHEVGSDGEGVVARELEGPKVLELVDPLQAVEAKLVDHPIVLVHCKEGHTLI